MAGPHSDEMRLWVTPDGSSADDDAVELQMRAGDSVSALIQEAFRHLQRSFPGRCVGDLRVFGPGRAAVGPRAVLRDQAPAGWNPAGIPLDKFRLGWLNNHDCHIIDPRS